LIAIRSPLFWLRHVMRPDVVVKLRHLCDSFNGGKNGSSVNAHEGDREMVKYLTTAEVAELLRAPIETVRYWRHVGKGPASFKVGRRVLYETEDVEEFIEQAKAGTAA
jgi:excisionase family DNA binding protein